MTEQLHFHFSLSCIGEGNGNPLQCSCLESPRDRGAWWAAVYEVAQSWTRVVARLAASQSEVEVDRGVVAAPEHEPARRVDADVVDQLVEGDELAAALRHLRALAVFDD